MRRDWVFREAPFDRLQTLLRQLRSPNTVALDRGNGNAKCQAICGSVIDAGQPWLAVWLPDDGVNRLLRESPAFGRPAPGPLFAFARPTPAGHVGLEMAHVINDFDVRYGEIISIHWAAREQAGGVPSARFHAHDEIIVELVIIASKPVATDVALWAFLRNGERFAPDEKAAPGIGRLGLQFWAAGEDRQSRANTSPACAGKLSPHRAERARTHLVIAPPPNAGAMPSPTSFD